MAPPKKKYKKKVVKAAPKTMTLLKLTCLECGDEIEEHTDALKPAAMIFDCLKCGKHWGVGSMTVHEGSTKNVAPVE